MNISDLIDQYEQGARLRGLAPTQMNALKPVRRAFGPCPLRNITPHAVSTYAAQRREGKWTECHGLRQAKDGTIRRELGALAAVLNWAHQKRILKDAPPSIDLPPMSPPREVFLNKEEADDLQLRAAVWNSKIGRFVTLGLETWARANAIETLDWARVDMRRGVIDYRDPLKPETSKRRVPVPMSSVLKNLLSYLIEERRFGLVVGPVTQYEWKRFLQTTPYADRGLTRHDLRRTGISLAVARGVDLMKIAQMAGDNYQTILKFYARFSPSYLDGCVE